MELNEHKHSFLDKLNWQKMNVLTAEFDDDLHAHTAVEQLVENGFPMEHLSVLHFPKHQQADFLGVSYENEHKRTIVWAENGALWGGLMGLAVGAAGLFFVPGIGTLLALGPVIDTIAGATIGSGLMAGAAQLTRVTHALQKIGIPEDKLEEFRDRLKSGKTILILHYAMDDPVDWQRLIDWTDAKSTQLFARQQQTVENV